MSSSRQSFLIMSSISPTATHRIPVIGIIGGIGSGKSSVAKWVAKNANVTVIDADQLGHRALECDDVKTALRTRFGDEIFDSAGAVRRSALAHLVFGEGEQFRQARTDLERVLHPAIELRVIDEIAQAERDQQEAVLLDAAVLLEAGWRKRCDAVVFVDAPLEVRQRRVALRNGWTADELQRREQSQLGIEAKKLQSNVVISNTKDNSEAGEELLEFLHRTWGICCKPLSNSSQQS